MVGVSDLKASGKWLARVIALAVVYYIVARLSLQLAFASTNVSPVWPPSGIALAAILLMGMRYWPGIFLGAFTANIVVFSANHAASELVSSVMSCTIAAGNTLEAVAGALILRRLMTDGDYFGQPSSIYKFVLAALLAAIVGASIGTSSLIIGGVVPDAAFWTISSIWWLGDGSGMLVLAPLLVCWSQSMAWRRPMREYLFIIVTMIVLGVVLWLIFDRQFSADLYNRWVAYLILPIIGWAAYNYQGRGVTLVLAVVTGVAVVASTHGFGPFATGTLQDSLMTLEIFIGLCSIAGLVLAADMNNRLRQDSTFSISTQPLSMLNWLTLFLCLGLTIVAWHYISSSTQRQAEERFKFIAETVKRRIDERMNFYENLLHAGQGLFAASHDVERSEWKQFVEHLKIQRDFPGVLGVGYAPRVTSSQLASFVQHVHAEGNRDFNIWPAGEREEYFPIYYLEPLNASNGRAIGFDMLSQETRHLAMNKARDTGEAAITGKLILVQDRLRGGEQGFVMYAPVYRDGASIATREEREAALVGYVYSPFRMHDLMMGILGNSLPEVALQIYDGHDELPDALMYSSEDLAKSKASYPNPFSVAKIISAVNDEKNWAIRITSLPIFEASIDRQKSLIVLITGSLISLLFFGIVGNLAKTRETAEALAEKMVAALKESNLSLRQSEERFRLLTSKVKDYAILLLNEQGLVMTWNEGAERLNGYRADEVVGKSFETFYQQEDVRAGKPMNALKLARQTGQYESSGWHVRRDGTRYFADILITALHDDNGAFIGFAKITRDITQERRAEQELRDAIEQAESASRAKSEFVANMSHELRTPMNAVLGVTYLLGNSSLTLDQKKYLDMIRTSGQSLLDILNDILDFSKIEAGRMELSITEFKLGDLLDAIATIMSVNAGEKDLELSIGIGPNVPQVFLGDALRLQQVMINLVGNAIKFTEMGEVSVSVELLKQDDDVATMLFKVKDSGIGMSLEQQARLFSPFTQADSSMTRRFGGSGLGLTICRRLVDLMSGNVTLHSELGRGSEFCASIPLKVVLAGADAKRPKSLLPKARLLIADDNRTSRDNLQRMAQQWGWETEVAASGTQVVDALRHAQVAGKSPDLVLLDWKMPDMDGIRTLAAIRKLQPKSLPVVFMVNAYGRSELMNLGAASQADFILAKPITNNSLFDTVTELLNNKPSVARESGGKSIEGMLNGVRILLAEDNVMNQIVAKGMLEQAGAKVDIVENGQMAVDLLRATPQLYHLILMDVQMPVMDGFTATRLIRSRIGSAIPVLAMTAGVTEAERIQCTEAGMDDFIGKPIDLTLMFAAIQRNLAPGVIRRIPAVELATVLTSVKVQNVVAPANDALSKEKKVSQRAVLDMRQLVDLCAGNAGYEATIAGMVQAIVDMGDAPVQQARSAFAAGEFKACAKLLHRMRGEIGSLGAERVTDASAACERAILEARHVEVPSLLDEVESALRLALAEAQVWLNTKAEKPTSVTKASEETAQGTIEITLSQNELLEFEALLHAQDIEACNRYQELRPAFALRLGESDLAALDDAVKRLDFTNVLVHVRGLQGDARPGTTL